MVGVDEIVIEYSGWCRIPASKIKFQYTGEDDSIPGIISGEDYIKLSVKERQNYIAENICDAMRDSDDSEWTDIQIIVE
jgi:hypothetical protein